jgi:hypothetical protein
VAAVPSVPERSVLIFDESCGNPKSTGILDELINKSPIEGDGYYLGCDKDLVDANKDTAYPFLYTPAVIGVNADPHFGAASKKALQLYEQGELSFEDLFAILKYDYYLNAHRWFGRANFDLEVIYDVSDANRLLTLLMIPAKRLLFLSDAAAEKLKSGDEFFRKSVLFAMEHSAGVFATSERAMVTCELLLPRGTSITLVENGGQMRDLLMAQELKKGGTVQ